MENISHNLELVKEYIKSHNGTMSSILDEVMKCSLHGKFEKENDKRISLMRDLILSEFGLDLNDHEQIKRILSSICDQEKRNKLCDDSIKRIGELSGTVEGELINCLILSHCKDDFDIYHVSLTAHLNEHVLKDVPISDALRKNLNL